MRQKQLAMQEEAKARARRNAVKHARRLRVTLIKQLENRYHMHRSILAKYHEQQESVLLAHNVLRGMQEDLNMLQEQVYRADFTVGSVPFEAITGARQTTFLPPDPNREALALSRVKALRAAQEQEVKVSAITPPPCRAVRFCSMLSCGTNNCSLLFAARRVCRRLIVKTHKLSRTQARTKLSVGT